jgi:hypothetical protein
VSYFSAQSIGHYEIAERRSAIFDERFFGPRGVNLRHIAQKTNTYVSMPNDDADPVRNKPLMLP